MHDNFPAYFSNLAVEFLNILYPNHLVGKRVSVIWLTRTLKLI